ncbi:MAG TPA: TetR/AcrR family transcriptional regulator [Galbitalea sp.]|jgi:AcrR family transcriptional regulator|nr:TetR/AcrR family transcriptional regulator [Galbitalea sp.]
MADSTSVALVEMPIPERLMRVSVELFAEQGYAQTSVQQIVDAAGVTKGALYHYFKSKDDLLFDIYDRLLSLQSEHLAAIVARGLDPVETVRLICEDVIVTSIDWLHEATVFFGSQHMLSPERQREVKRRRREYNDAFEAVLERGRADGVFRKDIPPAILIAHFFSDPHYLAQWYSPGGPLSKQQVAGELTDLYVAGLTAPATSPHPKVGI